MVQTGVSEDVAHRGARMLIELLQQHHAGEVVHVGFSGGVGMRTLAQRLAQLLREPIEHLPSAIVFHAMVAGFDVTDPTTDPNAFFSYFVRDPAMRVATSFVGLHAPAMAGARQLSQLRGQPGIKEAYAQAHEIQVIVTGASCWSDDHSLLHRYLEVANEPVDAFDDAGCVGDILWQPIGLDGPIELKTNLRAMTVMELGEVARFVSEKKHVLLVAGPCASCNFPKTEIVHAILEQDRRLITHLAVDSRCGRELTR